MSEPISKILAGLLIGSPATILMLGLLLNAYGVGATTTTITSGFLFSFILFGIGFYWIYNINKRLKKIEGFLNENEKKE